MSEDDRPSIAALKQIIERVTDPGPWRQGRHETYHVFVSDIEPLGGTAGERVVLRANTHRQYQENIAAVVALHNAAPVLLEIASAAMDYIHAEMTPGAGEESWAAEQRMAVAARKLRR